MEYQYNPEKTVQAAAILLKHAGGTLNYMKLIKLLYMADRNALDQLQEPITGAHYVSMDYGPVLSEVLSRIHYGDTFAQQFDAWTRHISAPCDYSVSLTEDPGNGELCEDEEIILKHVFEEYGNIEKFKLSQMTHEMFPEWQYPAGSAIPIQIVDILKALQKSDEEIAEIHSIISREQTLESLLAVGEGTNHVG